MHLKGVGVSFLGNLRRANKSYGTKEQTEAMCTKLLLNDVPISIAFEDGNVINKIWGIALKHKLDSAEWVPYYSKDNKIKSSNPKIAVSYYKCENGKYLIVLGNISKENQNAKINVGQLKQNVNSVFAEYREKSVSVKKDEIGISIPARNFMLVSF
jgi:hypothetical protein